MRKTKKILAFLFAFSLMFGCLSSTAFAITVKDRPEIGMTYNQPFASGTGGSRLFRIPCLVALDDGTVVAGCDARWSTSMDGGGLDTIVSYSKDKGKTWNYSLANYLGDNGDVANKASTAFIDPAMATDGKDVWMIADLYPAGIALNGAHYGPITGHTGYDVNGNLALKKGCLADTNGDGVIDVDVNGDGSKNAWDYAANVEYSYSLVKKENATFNDYYEIKAEGGNGAVEEGFTIDAWFNIKGTDVDTNLFCSDAPYHPYPTDFLYMTKSEDGGKTWSIPSLLDVKKASEQTLLIGPGRGMVTSEGRIVFTAYEFTYSDKNSCCIYSDDGGKTWTRGASVAGWSSEAVVTEADGKLYMFTRHGNAYYVSEDWAETWGQQLSTGLSYNSNCQLTAITYSEKIDGKTAILFAGPSDTGSRSAGKIFVGLVQEDGSFDWKYEYSVNGAGEAYAYSCLAELNDGTVGLLYEYQGAGITYENLSIKDIAVGAEVGDIWLTDNNGEVVTSYAMGSEQSATFAINGLAEDAQVSVESSNEGVLTAVVDNNVLTITTKAVTNLEQVVVKMVSGEEEIAVKVDITDAENYEILELRPGETKTYLDKTGNYGNTDVSSVDGNVANVTITGNSSQATIVTKAQLANATANFNGDIVDISDCLYTFTGSDGTYTITSADSNGTPVYLSLREAASGTFKFASENATTFTVEKLGGDDTFRLQDKAASGGGAHLYFWINNASKLHFDRNSTYSGYENNCSFYLYTPSADAPEDSLISGYKKVDEIQDGGQYLIVSREATDGNSYVLHPSLGTNAYENAAKVIQVEVDVEEVKSELAVQLATALGTDGFNGETRKISDCLYTFTSTGTENQYNICGKDANGNNVYLKFRGDNSGKIGKTEAASINVVKHASEAKFSIQDVSGSGSGHLFFHDHQTNMLRFNINSSIDANHCYYELYTPSADAPEDSLISGYEKVSEIQNGGQYLIVTIEAADGYRYLMNPSLETSAYNHVARITDQMYEEENLLASTEIVIEAKGEGNTFIKVGDVTYYIVVKNAVENVELAVEDCMALYGEIQKQDANQSVVTVEKNTDGAPYVQADVIEDGKYLIGKDPYIVVNEPSNVADEPAGLAMRSKNFLKDDCEEYAWTVTKVDNGYTIQDANGKYMTFSNASGNKCEIGVSDESQTLRIISSAKGGYTVTDGTYYFNNFKGDNDSVAGWAGDDNPWYFYKPADCYIITGATEGTTVITSEGVDYYITVTAKAIDKTELRKLYTENSYKDESTYTVNSWKVFEDALKAANSVLDDTNAKEEDVNAAKTVLENAINGLVDKSQKVEADYTAVDAAIASVPEDLSIYTEETVKAVEDALAAVVRELDITKQDEVDAFAKAITDAIAALQEKVVVVKYQITYVLKGGENHSGNPTSYTNESDTITLQAPTKAGYKFVGWYIGDEEVTEIAKGRTGDITLTAKWKSETYKISYYKLSGGKNSTKNPTSYKVTTTTIELKKPTRKGYDFVGWYSDSKFKKQVSKIDKGTTGDIKLYAKWKAKEYTIKYKLNGGKNSSRNPKKYTVETSKITLKSPTRKGYKFVGWYSNSKMTKKVTKISKGSTGNVTLYAKWKKK